VTTPVPLTGLLPIARNGGSDVLFLNLNPATHGQLHAFLHAIAWPGYLGDHVFTKVADDFDAYLDSLFIDPDTAEDTWADVAGSDPADPWRRTVEEWLGKELPAWRAEAWATPLTSRRSPGHFPQLPVAQAADSSRREVPNVARRACS
jgi:hypothetical protein